MNIGALIGIVVSIVIGVALLPVVANTVSDVSGDLVADYPQVASLLDILPIIVVTLLIIGAVGYFAGVGRNSVQ